MRDFGTKLEKWVAYNVKLATHSLLDGSMKDHYSKVGRHLEELKRSNSNFIFILKIDPSNTNEIHVFQRFFVYFEDLKNGMASCCRPILCIGVAFLKTLF